MAILLDNQRAYTRLGGGGCGDYYKKGLGMKEGAGVYSYTPSRYIFVALYSLLVFEPLSEEKTFGKRNHVCVENPQNEVKESLNDTRKPDRHLEQATEEKQCPLKPKILKFKKVKDGKLSFTGSKNYTKLHHRQSKCVHVSPLKFVGNDPESESQTLRGYLDEECEPVVVKAKQVDDCSAASSNADDSGQKERGFLASLHDADIECVAVVCKRKSNIIQNGCQVSDDSACESVKQEENDGIDDDKHKIRQDSKEDVDSKAIKVDIFDTQEKTSESVSPIMLANSSCKREDEQERTSPVKLYSAKSQCSDESCSEMETDSISEVENCDPSCSRSKQYLKGEICTESSVLSQSEFVSKNNGDVEPVSALSNASSGSFSHEIEFAHVDDMASIDKNDDGPSSKSVGDGSEQDYCNMQSVEENVESSTVDNSSITAKCLLQNDTCKENVSNKIDSGKVKTNVASGCIDEDSSDDFQVSSIRNSQMAPPVCIAQKSSKTKKRKGTKKSKNKTVTREVRNHKNSQKLPTEWPCSACTFINDGQLLECSICLTPRVGNQESSCKPNSKDVGFKMSNEQSCDDVEMVEVGGVSEVPVGSENINSASDNRGQNGMVAKHDMILEGIDGSGQLVTRNDAGKAVALPHSTPVHDVLVDSKEASTDASKARHSSTAMKEAMAVDCSDKGQITESGLPPWSCSVCTFLNLSQMIECSICLTPRRRSQRLSASKHTHTVERQEKDCLNKNKASKRRRWERDRVKKDKNRQEMDVDFVSCSVTDIDESRGVNSIKSHCDHDTSVADAEGLTPEPVESSPHGTDSRLGDGGLEVDSSQDGSGGIKSKPRKRLKLEEVEADSDISDEIRDFSDDSDSLCQNRALTCSLLVSSSTDPKEPAPCIPFVDKDATSSEDCFLSTDDDKVEPKPRQKTDSCLNGKTTCFEVYPDKLDVSAHSVGAIGSSENALAASSLEVAISDNSLSCQQSGSRVVENLEDLKAAAEELFMSEWEDDDFWWEGDSCSGQSSLPSSSEAASSSPTIKSPGFTKCSDLYSITELKKKLQTSPEQPKTCTTAAVDNIQQFELAGNLDNKMPSSSLTQGNVTPETAAVLEEEEEADEPDDIPEAMKLKFCLSLYTERVYLYDEVNHAPT